MKIKSVLFIVILSIFTLSQSCSKEELKLNEDYITVSDLWRYVNQKGICEDATKWLNKEVKVKGHIDYNSFYELFLNYGYKLNSFYLIDFRNETKILVCLNDDFLCSNNDTLVTSQDSAIINKILNSNETDMCYIKGILYSHDESIGLSRKILTNIRMNNEDDIIFKSDIDY